jgi:hypothetical protein
MDLSFVLTGEVHIHFDGKKIDEFMDIELLAEESIEKIYLALGVNE